MHVHVGSQLAPRRRERARASSGCSRSLERLALDAARARPRRRARRPPQPRRAAAVGRGVRRPARPQLRAARASSSILEPGRSLVGRAGVTLYRVGSVKEIGRRRVRGDRRRHVRQPAPAALRRPLRGAAREPRRRAADGVYRIAGKHCESGDVLIEAAELPEPRPGDVLAVPATGAYTLALGSTYNGVPRPAVVLVGGRRGAADPAPRDGATICYASNRVIEADESPRTSRESCSSQSPRRCGAPTRSSASR